MNELAVCYQDAGQLEHCARCTRTCSRRTSRLGPDHPDTLFSMHQLALAYKAARKYDRAIELLQKTLAARRTILGSDHLDTAKTMTDLALLYRLTDHPDRAIPLFEEGLHSERRSSARITRTQSCR